MRPFVSKYWISLLGKYHLLGDGLTCGIQSVEIDAAGNGRSVFIGTIPGDAVVSGSHHTIDQSAYQLTLDIVDTKSSL